MTIMKEERRAILQNQEAIKAAVAAWDGYDTANSSGVTPRMFIEPLESAMHQLDDRDLSRALGDFLQYVHRDPLIGCTWEAARHEAFDDWLPAYTYMSRMANHYQWIAQFMEDHGHSGQLGTPRHTKGGRLRRSGIRERPFLFSVSARPCPGEGRSSA